MLDNTGHVEYRRGPALPATGGRNLNTRRNPAFQLQQNSALNLNLVYLFLDEFDWQDMKNGLTIMPKSGISR